MININYSMCVGCGACISICPVNAITMETNNCGFEYPYVDHLKCIKCGLCEKVCLCYEKKTNIDSTCVSKIYIAKHIKERRHLSDFKNKKSA